MARAIFKEAGKLAIASVDSGPLTVLDFGIANVLGYVDGVLVFGRLDGTISAVPFDLAKRTVTGDPVTLLTGVNAKTEGGLNAALSHTGTLVFLRGSSGSQLLVADAKGASISQSAERAQFRNARWSPDGAKIAVQMRGSGAASIASDVWLYDVATTSLSRLTTSGAGLPAWSPDGKWIAYQGLLGDVPVMVVPVDGSAPPRVVAVASDEPNFTPDGQSIVVRRVTARGTANLVRLSLTEPATEEILLGDGGFHGQPSVSPDGKWLAYVTEQDGRQNVFVRSMSPGGGRVQLSTGNGVAPRWGWQPNTLYYRADNRVRRVTLNLTGGLPTVTARDSLLALPSSSSTFDVHPDGRQFVYVRDGVEDARPVVFTNWARTVVGKLRKP